MYPFLKILIPAIVGIVLADMFDFPAGWLFALFAAMFGCAVWLRKHIWGGVYLWSAVALLYMFFMTLWKPSSGLPHGVRVTATARILDNPEVKGRWARHPARVRSFNSEGAWHSTTERILLYADTSHTLHPGDDIAFSGYFNAVGSGGYGTLMHRRGYTAASYLTPGNLIYRLESDRHSLRDALSGLQARASARLSRLGLGADEEPIAQAMLLGNISHVPRERRMEYSRAGTAHILSVSGLHVGIVFLFINVLLWFVPVFRGGHIAKNIIAIIAIWFYAALCGLSPPVVRSAFLFTGTQLAFALSARSQPLNTLFATAALMLAASPNSLWDVSFQLSFTAVLFIMLWGVPLFRLLRSRNVLLNALTGAIVISVTASAATAPLVAYHFGYFSLAGVIINPLIGILSYVIIIGALIWLIMPLSFLAPALSWAVGGSIAIQNRFSHWGSELTWATAAASPGPAATLAVYAVYILATVGITLIPEREKALSLPLE